MVTDRESEPLAGVRAPPLADHTSVTHPLESGSDLRTVQELLGHRDVKTMMIYTHILHRGPAGVCRPLDGM
ncbi:MAG: hypothetical protein CV090_13065 [Nitrospira sp. WS238]|nr:hypothetical protein [Nitrospira sp. WS238]